MNQLIPPHGLRPFRYFLAAGWFAGVLSVMPAAASAQTDPAYRDIVTAVLKANPDIRIARLRVDSARAETRIARALPNPSATIAPQVPYQYVLTAPLDVGPVRTERIRAAGAGLSATIADSRDFERQLRFTAGAAYFDLVVAEDRRDLAHDEARMVGELLAADSARVRAGDAPERVLVAGELELAKATTAVAQAHAAVRAARIALQLLMGSGRLDSAFTVARVADAHALDLTLRLHIDSASEARPDVDAAAQRAIASRALDAQARALLLPVPSVALVVQPDAPFANGQNTALGLSLQFPLLSWYGGERERARAGAEQARIAEERARRQARAEAEAAVDQFTAANALRRRYDAALLAKSREAVERDRYAYRAGALSYVELIDALRTWGQIRNDALTATHDAWVAALALNRAFGREIITP